MALLPHEDRIDSPVEYALYALAVRQPMLFEEAERFTGGMLASDREACRRVKQFVAERAPVQPAGGPDTVERVARLMHDQRWPAYHWDRLTPSNRAKYLEDARAVVADVGPVGRSDERSDYVCPQCGPAPEGPEAHAEQMHTWPPMGAKDE